MVRITLEVQATEQVVAQMKRAGFEVCREGRRLLLRVPNQILPSGAAEIRFEEVTPATALPA